MFCHQRQNLQEGFEIFPQVILCVPPRPCLVSIDFSTHPYEYTKNVMQHPVSSIDTIIFDFDGTLAELHLDFALMKKKIAATAACFLEYEPSPNSLPALEWLEELAEEISRSDVNLGKEFHTRGRLIITAMELDAAKKGKLFPYSKPVLSRLRDKGIKTAVITRNCTPALTAVFPDIRSYCEVVLPRDSVLHVKPHPGHVGKAMEELQSTPDRALVVGDHPIDIHTAREAGTLAGAVASGHASLEVLQSSSPDFLARNCQELIKQLEENGLLQ